MSKYDFQLATEMLVTWKNSFDDYLKSNAALNPKHLIAADTAIGQIITKIHEENNTDSNIKNLNFQYLKMIQIANDIHHLKSINDETLSDWLEDELETVFLKIKDLLASLEKTLN